MSEQAHDRPPRLHLGCGEDYRPGYHNVDYVDAVDPDEQVDLNHYPWPWPDGSFQVIRAEHVFEHLEQLELALRECERLLKSGGRLITVWPIGTDAIADPDHKRLWTWRTPEFYCGSRHWDLDVGLEVVDRDVDLWSQHPSSHVRGIVEFVVDRWLRVYGPGPWCFDLSTVCGEFTVEFKKP